MERFFRNYPRSISLAAAGAFFFLLAFLIPYSPSLWDVKMSLARNILGLCSFGNSDPAYASFDYTYCLFVPVIFGYLVSLRWKEIQSTPMEGSNSALWLMFLGIFIYWFGLRAENQYFGYASLQILLAAVTIWLWGWKVFRIILFPWAFFLFAWPMPFLDPMIAFPLRMIMSGLASHLLPIIGVPCMQNGTALISPPDISRGLATGARFQIDIADPCSGIRSLFALLMTSALFAYLFVDKLWQQWVIFLSAFPLAIFGNLVRVIMLVLGSIWFGSAFAIGTTEKPSTFHEGCGFAVYAVALGTEVFLASLLTRKWNFPKHEPTHDHDYDFT